MHRCVFWGGGVVVHRFFLEGGVMVQRCFFGGRGGGA